MQDVKECMRTLRKVSIHCWAGLFPQANLSNLWRYLFSCQLHFVLFKSQITLALFRLVDKKQKTFKCVSYLDYFLNCMYQQMIDAEAYLTSSKKKKSLLPSQCQIFMSWETELRLGLQKKRRDKSDRFKCELAELSAAQRLQLEPNRFCVSQL